MKYAKSAACLILLLFFASIQQEQVFGAAGNIKLKSYWEDISHEQVDLNVFLKGKKEMYVLLFRAIDCYPCIEREIAQLKKYEKEVLAIIGYIYESELAMFSEFKNELRILRDTNYELYRRLRLRKPTPLILKLNSDLEVVEIIDLF
jgi:hypothetical protein